MGLAYGWAWRARPGVPAPFLIGRLRNCDGSFSRSYGKGSGTNKGVLSMHIVFAASECVPYAKTGGVAEVVAALPKELVRQGHQVTVYVPLYRQVQKHLKERKIAIRSLTIPFSYYNRFVTVVNGGTPDGVQIYFIDCPELFDREFLYETASGDYADNAERFGLFCRAVLDSTKILGVPDVFHIHGWPAG